LQMLVSTVVILKGHPESGGSLLMAIQEITG